MWPTYGTIVTIDCPFDGCRLAGEPSRDTANGLSTAHTNQPRFVSGKHAAAYIPTTEGHNTGSCALHPPSRSVRGNEARWEQLTANKHGAARFLETRDRGNPYRGNLGGHAGDAEAGIGEDNARRSTTARARRSAVWSAGTLMARMAPAAAVSARLRLARWRGLLRRPLRLVGVV